MLDAIKRFFQSSMNPPSDVAVDGPGRGDVRLAACALLLELAHADQEFTEEERTHLESAVRRQFGLDAEEAETLLALAEEERRQAVDLWQFTNLIAERYSHSQKMVLAEVMWGLVYADGELGGKEDYLMRKISNLLRLEAGYLVRARERAHTHLDGGGEGSRVQR